MTKQQVINAAVATVEEMRMEIIPRDTGNMAYNSLQYKISRNEIVIYINTKIAPYVPYTNEPLLSTKWHEKQNLNEGWWDTFAQTFIKKFNNKLGGHIQ